MVRKKSTPVRNGGITKKRKKTNCNKYVNKKSSPDLNEGVLLFPDPPTHINNRRIAALEPCIIDGEGTLKSNSMVTFPLKDKAWYLFNQSSKFFALVKLVKAENTGTKENPVYSEWKDVTSADKKNLLFYPNAISKRFGEVYFSRNQNDTSTCRGYSRLSNSLESYIYSHLPADKRKLIFGSTENDSSYFNGLLSSDYGNGNEEYDEIAERFFEV